MLSNHTCKLVPSAAATRWSSEAALRRLRRASILLLLAVFADLPTASAAPVFPNLEGSFALSNEDTGVSRSYSTTAITVTGALKAASAFRLLAVVATGSDSAGADIRRGDIAVRIFAGPEQSAAGDVPLAQTRYYSIVEDGQDEFGAAIETETLASGVTSIARPQGGFDYGRARSSSDASSNYAFFQLDLSQDDNASFAAVIENYESGETFSLGISEATGRVDIMTALDVQLGTRGAFLIGSSGGVFEDMNGSLLLVAVPEPTSACLGLGLLSILTRRGPTRRG